MQAWVQQLRDKTPVVMNPAGRVYPNGTPPNGVVAPKSAAGAPPSPAGPWLPPTGSSPDALMPGLGPSPTPGA